MTVKDDRAPLGQLHHLFHEKLDDKNNVCNKPNTKSSYSLLVEHNSFRVTRV